MTTDNDAKQIPLTKGKVALVNTEDFDFINQWKWHVTSKGYAMRWDYSAGYKKPKMIRMHRLLNNTPEGLETDHINGNKLDNRRSNIRTVTKVQNAANQTSPNLKNNKYKGVSMRKGGNRWQAQIRPAGARKCLGDFGTPEEAALAYNDAATKLWGKFAKLNEVKI